MTLCYLSLFSLWLGPVISFYTAFLCQSSYFFSLTWAMVGHFFSSVVVVVCYPPLLTVWAWTYLTREEQALHLRGTHCMRGAANSLCMRMIDTPQTLPLALIGCIELGAVDSCKSIHNHSVASFLTRLTEKLNWNTSLQRAAYCILAYVLRLHEMQ